MKRLLLLLTLLLCTSACFAGSVNLAWDPMPVTESWTLVRIYERTGTADNYTYVNRVEVPAALTSISLTGVKSGSHTYVARAFDGTVESVDSNSVTATILPGAPANLKLKIP
jgi:hypothetical protein